MATSRGEWSNWFEFFLSLLGSLVGLGNIWRFPYILFDSGGAAFLVPYFISMFVCGIPAILLQLSYPQYASLGPGRVWIICPLFQGIGYGMVVITSVISIYYNVILAWTLFYVAGSFSAALPWSTCDNEWNTPLCQVKTGQSLYGNVTDDSESVFNQSTILTNQTVSPSEEYWRLHVLQISSGIEEPGKIQWKLLLCLLGAWVAVFLILIKDIKSSGKVAYIAATLPYAILLALLIRGSLLPGAVEGIKYYVIPEWKKLLDTQVWRNGASQVFYSLGTASGAVVTLASYNRFHNNCYRDAMLFPILDCFTSLFAGFIIFVYLGYMSHQSGVPISEVVKEGPGLAFIAYPDAVTTMPLPQLWSVLFFLLLFTVGLDSQFVHVQIITTALTDAFPKSLGQRKLLVTAAVCMFGFVIGISCVTQGGIYVLTLMDWYLGSVSVLVLSGSEMFVLASVYGVNRLYDDIEMMIGYRIPVLWKPMWLVVTPLFVLILLIMGLLNFSPVNLGGLGYPTWARVTGWFIAMCPLFPIPIGMLVTVWKEDGENLKEKILQSIKPRKSWRPATGNIVDKQNGSLEELKALNQHT